MAWNAVYETSTGRLLSVGTVVDSLPANVSSKSFAGRPVGLWNEVTLDFDQRPANPVINKDVFLSRFTPLELRDIFGVDFNTADIAVIAFVRLLIALDKIDLSDDVVTAGMTKLVQAGSITAGRAAIVVAYA